MEADLPDTFEQAKALGSSLLRGDPKGPSIVRNIYRQVIAGWKAA